MENFWAVDLSVKNWLTLENMVLEKIVRESNFFIHLFIL